MSEKEIERCALCRQPPDVSMGECVCPGGPDPDAEDFCPMANLPWVSLSTWEKVHKAILSQRQKDFEAGALDQAGKLDGFSSASFRKQEFDKYIGDV